MKVGVGITTYKRPTHLALCLEQIRKHSPADLVLHVSDDSVRRKGISFRKNDCLNTLWQAGCDYFFLLDDDCFPIADGWLDHYIQTSQRTGQEHMCYTPNRLLKVQDGVMLTYECSGALIFLTRKAVAAVGGFFTGYTIYGYEHTAYTQRIHKAGLTSFGPFLTPVNAEQYVYALDLNTHLPFNDQLGHRSTLTEAEKSTYLSRNKHISSADTVIYRPLPAQRVVD